MRYLLDTNVISEMRRIRSGKADPRVTDWAAQVDPGDLFISAITVFESELAILSSERRDPKTGGMLRLWFETQVMPAFDGRILPLDAIVARRAAALHVPNPRPDRDAFIAATALIHHMTVVTRNVVDFKPAGLAVFNPWAG